MVAGKAKTGHHQLQGCRPRTHRHREQCRAAAVARFLRGFGRPAGRHRQGSDCRHRHFAGAARRMALAFRQTARIQAEGRLAGWHRAHGDHRQGADRAANPARQLRIPLHDAALRGPDCQRAVLSGSGQPGAEEGGGRPQFQPPGESGRTGKTSDAAARRTGLGHPRFRRRENAFFGQLRQAAAQRLRSLRDATDPQGRIASDAEARRRPRRDARRHADERSARRADQDPRPLQPAGQRRAADRGDQRARRAGTGAAAIHLRERSRTHHAASRNGLGAATAEPGAQSRRRRRKARLRLVRPRRDQPEGAQGRRQTGARSDPGRTRAGGQPRLQAQGRRRPLCLCAGRKGYPLVWRLRAARTLPADRQDSALPVRTEDSQPGCAAADEWRKEGGSTGPRPAGNKSRGRPHSARADSAPCLTVRRQLRQPEFQQLQLRPGQSQRALRAQRATARTQTRTAALRGDQPRRLPEE